MKKHFIPIFIPILIFVYFCKVLFADRYDEANIYYLDAYNLYRMGKVDQSMELLKKVIEIDPDHAEAHFGMGSIYFRQNMYDDAVREFTRVTRIKPEYAQAYERLWLAYKKLGINDKAEESLQNYRKIIAERMQSMAGEAPQIVKPVTPPPQQEKSSVAESQTSETRAGTSQPSEKESSGKTVPETKLAESRPSETEEEKKNEEAEEKKNIISVVKPVITQLKESAERSDKEAKTSISETIQPGTASAKLPKQSSKIPSNTYPVKESKDTQVNVNKYNTEYQNTFKPFKMIGSILFKNPFRKSIDKQEKSFKDKFLKCVVYYIMTVQVWLCVVTSLFVYSRKKFHKRQISREEFQSNQKDNKQDLYSC